MVHKGKLCSNLLLIVNRGQFTTIFYKRAYDNSYELTPIIDKMFIS